MSTVDVAAELLIFIRIIAISLTLFSITRSLPQWVAAQERVVANQSVEDHC